MAFSLVFSVIDAATAPIKQIAAALSEPTRAAAAVGEAGEQAGISLDRGMNRAHDAVRRLGDAFRVPLGRLAELGKAAGEASEKFAHSFAGMGAVVAEGFSIKDVAGQEEFWKRVQINTDMTGAATVRLREDLNDASVEFGVAQSAMTEVFKAFRATGGSAEVLGENARTAAAMIQLTGASAENAGKMFAVLQTKMHLEHPEDFLNATALIRKQVQGIEGGVDAFAEAIDRMGDSVEALGLKGPQAVAALGAVYAVAAKGAGGNARKAISATEGWLSDLRNKDYRAQLSQGLGERATDQNDRVKDPRELMQKMAAKYGQALTLPEDQQVAAIARLDALFGESAAKMFKAVGGEIKATGHSETMDRILGAKGDSVEMMHKAAEAGETLTAAMNRLKGSMAIAAESVFAGPIETFANALNACGGVVGKVVMALAALAVIGHIITWVAGAVAGFRLLQATLLTFRIGSLVSGLAGIATGMVPVIAATWAWTAALLANPITWVVLAVVAAIAAVGTAIYALYTHWDKIWKAIGGTVMTAVMPITYLATVIKETLGGAWDWVGNKVKDVIDWASRKLDVLIDKLNLVKGWVGDTTRPARTAAKKAVAAVANSAPVKYVGHAVGQVSAAVGDKTRQAVAFFEGKGWGHNQAAGIAASLAAESGFKPGAVGDSGHAYGLGQWHGDRQAEFAKWAGHDIRQSTMEEQMGFAHYELTEGKEKAAGKALAQTSTAADAGAVVSKRYERPADREGEAARRAASAEAIAAQPSPMEPPQPLSRSDLASGGTKTPGVVVVRFENLPKGANPQVQTQSPDLGLQLDRGPSMAMG